MKYSDKYRGCLIGGAVWDALVNKNSCPIFVHHYILLTEKTNYLFYAMD